MANAVPIWASFMAPERFAWFIERLEAALRERASSLLLNVEEGTLVDGEPPFKASIVDLAQTCNQLPLDDWEAQIRHFVDQAVRLPDGDVPKDLESLRPLIKVRLYSTESLGDARTVKLPLAEGLTICLALDLPDRVVTFDSDVARGLGLSSEELFDLGMANVEATVQAERAERELRNGGRIVSLSGDDFFTTSLALALDVYAGPEPRYGFLVAVPNRHEVLAVPIESARSIGVLPALVTLARDTFQKGPGSISPYVYWVRLRRWAALTLEESDQGLGVAGPEAFVEEVLKPLLG